VERHFGGVQAPHAVEWLSDTGSLFTARDTLDFAAALGLVPCFTPVRSPESNGIAEAFVKTFKRDYARVHPLPDAATQCSGRSLGGSMITTRATLTQGSE
jgi:putative transposase